MAYGNFIPTVWNEAINRELERLCVFAEDCNRSYEGTIKNKGESVKILGVGKPTITTIAKSARNNDIRGAETIEDTSIIMPINVISYFNYKIGDIDKAQAVDGVMDALSKETSEGLANEVDRYIANLAIEDPLAVKYSATDVKVEASNVLQEFNKAIRKLYENDVKQNTEIVATVSPRFYFILKEAYTDLDTNNSELLKNGRVGKYGNVTIKMSNNVAKSANGATDYIQVKTRRAIAFAKPLTHTEAYRPENGFSDAVKGFILYDAKIVRPKEMFVMNVKYA